MAFAKAPLPENEEIRLLALQNTCLLDSQAEKKYDDLTQLAAHICQTRIALISLIDADRQWFKSKVGIDATETSRDVSFCSHAILQPKSPLVVDDARKDARFKDNPLVTGELNLRFYAGVPILNDEGYPLGTLCCIDTVPKKLTSEQLDNLVVLAHQISTQIQLGETHEKLKFSNEALKTANDGLSNKNKQLASLRDDMENILFTTDIGAILLDEYVRVRWYTPAAKAHFDLLNDDIGRPITQLKSLMEFDQFESVLESVRDSGTSREFEVKNQEKWYLMRVHPYQSASKNSFPGLVVTFVNINLIKEITSQISQRNEDLQNFAYAVSHDFIEPVRILTAFSQLLIKDTGPHQEDKDIEFLINQIEQSSENLGQMTNGLLHFSRVITQGNELSELHLMDCLAKAELKLQDQRSGVNLEVDCEDLPMILGDQQQLTEVFFQLLSNSVAFRPKGEDAKVTIDSVVRDNSVLIKYQDNGIGVHLDQPMKIFNIFFNFADGQSTKGKGIGLAICKRIIERHGGTIVYVPSKMGTQFNIKFPLYSKKQTEHKLETVNKLLA